MLRQCHLDGCSAPDSDAIQVSGCNTIARQEHTAQLGGEVAPARVAIEEAIADVDISRTHRAAIPMAPQTEKSGAPFQPSVEAWPCHVRYGVISMESPQDKGVQRETRNAHACTCQKQTPKP